MPLTTPQVSTAPARIGGRIIGGTSGSVLFVDSSLNFAQDNAQLFWDDTNNRLGIGTTGPVATLAVNGTLVVNGANVLSGTSGPSTVMNILGSNTGIGFGGLNTVGYIEALNGNSAALRYDASNYQAFRTGSTLAERMRIDTTGNVGIGTTSPATSALLDLTSTTGALLLTRMTTTQRDALTGVNGMLIYNSTLGKFQGYEAGAWTSLI